MDKVTQVMVANKAAALKSDVKKNVGGFIGGDDDEKREKAEMKQRNNSIREMEERRERERQQRLETHKKRDEEREKMRSKIRDKYKLKGSDQHDGTYDYKGGADVTLAENVGKIKEEEESSCCIQ